MTSTAPSPRDTAYSWHSGQWSPLYAFASSGIIDNRNALLNEIDENIEWTENDHAQDPDSKSIDLSDLIALREFVLRLPATKDGKARAPWAKP